MEKKHEQPLNILLIDDEEVVHQALSPYLRDSGHDVDNARDGINALKLIEANDYDLALIDIRMPGMDGLSVLSRIGEMRPELSSIIITSHGNMEMVIQALRLGAADFLTKPIRLLELDAVLEKSKRIRQLRQRQRHLLETIRGIQTSEDIRLRNRSLIGDSKAMCEVRKQIQLAVEARCETVLILGETGTGKEVVAREIHFMGGDDERPFIPVNCPALPDSLVESELFGHMKGAFTGATLDRAGYFELADGGTLFLDEIADLSQSAQSKILRVLETRRLRRVGGTKEKEVNIQIIAATNAPLQRLIESQRFRKDLFYRLNLFTIKLLPLRERPSDIMPLAEHFLSAYLAGRRLSIEGFSQEARDKLMNYAFPGNARELRNLVERAAILCRTGMIEPRHISIQDFIEDLPSCPRPSDDDQERKKILAALEEAKWNRRKAAEALGMPYSTFRFKLSKLGIG
ncbi:sigma-54-dependent Fis family transcriptional regulator [bacterium]|nr:sigma-54-dependent Fis family transcriptional regulator [bacterium]